MKLRGLQMNKKEWQEHCKWLDTFRGKIMSKENEEEEERQKTIKYAKKQNKKRKTSQWLLYS